MCHTYQTNYKGFPVVIEKESLCNFESGMLFRFTKIEFDLGYQTKLGSYGDYWRNTLQKVLEEQHETKRVLLDRQKIIIVPSKSSKKSLQINLNDLQISSEGRLFVYTDGIKNDIEIKIYLEFLHSLAKNIIKDCILQSDKYIKSV